MSAILASVSLLGMVPWRMCEMVLIPKLQEDNILPIEMPFFFAINLILFAILVELYMNTPLFFVQFAENNQSAWKVFTITINGDIISL